MCLIVLLSFTWNL